MTDMHAKLIRALIGATVATAAIAVTIAVPPAARAQLATPPPCARVVGIDPQVTAVEDSDILTFKVHTAGCPVAGTVAYIVSDGSARRPADFALSNGAVHWDAGDEAPRTITARLTRDTVPEIDLKDFTVTLTAPTPGVNVVAGVGTGRVLDNDRALTVSTIDGQICPYASTTGASAPVEELCNWKQEDTSWIRLVRSHAFTGASVRVDTAADTNGGSTAVEGVDFLGIHQRVSFPPGALSVSVPITITPHATPGMRFAVRLSDPSDGILVGAAATVTIVG